jgi:hypothetical protein
MDASSFQWTSGANGMGLTDHSTCYLKACNCLVTFGGTSTGSATDVTDVGCNFIFILFLKII